MILTNNNPYATVGNPIDPVVLEAKRAKLAATKKAIAAAFKAQMLAILDVEEMTAEDADMIATTACTAMQALSRMDKPSAMNPYPSSNGLGPLANPFPPSSGPPGSSYSVGWGGGGGLGAGLQVLPSMNSETFGARIIREVVAMIPGVLRLQQSTPKAIVEAIAAAKEAGLMDVVETLKAKLASNSVVVDEHVHDDDEHEAKPMPLPVDLPLPLQGVTQVPGTNQTYGNVQMYGNGDQT